MTNLQILDETFTPRDHHPPQLEIADMVTSMQKNIKIRIHQSIMIYWNDWVNGLYYISDAKMYGLQNLLIRIMNNIQFLKVSSNTALLGTQNIDLPGSSVRMAMAMIGILPIMDC